MKTSTTNWLLFFAFAIACGTAYHYKTKAAHAQVVNAGPNAQLTQMASPPANANPQFSQPNPGPAAPANTGQNPAPSQKVSHTHTPTQTPASTSPSSASTPEDGQSLRAALKLLNGNNVKEGIYKLEALAFDSAGTKEAAIAQAKLNELEKKYNDQAQAYEKRGDLIKARSNYTLAFFATWDKERRDELYKHVSELNEKLFRSKKPGSGLEYHRVVAGESLAVIAKRHGMNWMTLKRMNRLKSNNIRVGQKLKIMTGKMSIDICKSRFELVILMDGNLFKRFYVATGKDDRTPEGQFTIEERIIKPTWYGPDGVYPFGHEKHILGTRWLGFNRTEEIDGFGIHGTKFPESIGSEASMGCIRMRNEEVEVVFDYTPRKTVISIR